MRVFVVLSLAYCLPGLAQQFRPERPSDNPLAGNIEAIQSGKKLYTVACAACHGQTGEGGRGPNLSDGRLVRRLDDRALFNAIQKGVPGTDMPAFKMADEKGWQLVTYVRSLGAPAFESQVAGAADAGAALFWGKANCSGCHMIRGRGGQLGPDLTNIGMRRSLKQLRESLQEPSARLVEGFVTADVILHSGKTISGVAKDNTNYSVLLLDRDGGLHRISKQEVKELKLSLVSRMPSDIRQRLSETEFQDLIAYLSRQAIRPEQNTPVARNR